MAEMRALARLLRLRKLEEEQRRTELEAAVAGQSAIDRQLESVRQERASLREEFNAGAIIGDATARKSAVLQAGLVEVRQRRLEPRLAEAEAEVLRQREEFLLRRTEKRQVETLIQAGQQHIELDAARRAQLMLDDWYGKRRQVSRRTVRMQRGPGGVSTVEARSKSALDRGSFLDFPSEDDAASESFP